MLGVFLPGTSGFSPRGHASVAILDSGIGEHGRMERLTIRIPGDLGYVDRDYIKRRLEAAGLTLMCLPAHGTCPAAFKSAWPEIVRSITKADYPKDAPRPKPPQPPTQAIDAMDEAFGWIPLAGADAIQTKRLLWLRALIWPLSRKPVWPLRQLQPVFGRDRETIAAWHTRGLDRIALRLNYPAWKEPAGGALP